MNLKSIKKTKDSEKNFAEFVFKTIDLLKEIVCIKDTVYYLGYKKSLLYFLSSKTVYVLSVDMKYSNDENILLETIKIDSLYSIKFLNKSLESESDIEFTTLVSGKVTYTPKDFLDWVTSPCDINIEIDVPFFDVIRFLNIYTKETFKTKRYIFYSKRDDDYSYIMNFYAYDKKTKAEMKLYVQDCWDENRKEFRIPNSFTEITVEVLSGSVSSYQKRDCKLEFLKLANQVYDNGIIAENYYWLMELVKLTIQPQESTSGWAIHRCFAGEDIPFKNIWVDDYFDSDEEPYFFITDSDYTWDTKKVATINFKSATYHSTGFYKQGKIKLKKWELEKDYLKKLTDFLKSPAKIDDSRKTFYGDWVKTNWDMLIFEYNHNTACWYNKKISPDKDKNIPSDIEALPFGLPIPDYTQIHYPEKFDTKKWNTHQCTLYEDFKQYLHSLNLIGQTINKIKIIGNIYNHVNTLFDYINGKWFTYNNDNEYVQVDEEEKIAIEKSNMYKPYQVENTSLELDEPIIFYIGDRQIEFDYTETGNVKISVNSLTYGNAKSCFNYNSWTDVSKNFSKNIIGHKIIDIEIKPYVFDTDVNGEEYGLFSVDRKADKKSFDSFFFVLDNGYKIGLEVINFDFLNVWEKAPNKTENDKTNNDK